MGRDVICIKTETGEVSHRWQVDKYELPNKKQHISCLAVSGNSCFVGAGTEPAGAAYIWNAKTAEQVKVIKDAGPTILNSIVFSPDSMLFATSEMWANTKVRVWRMPKNHP